MINSSKQQTLSYIFKKYEFNPVHSRQVTKLALILFDKTKGVLHNLSDREKSLLEAGSLLHDIGYFVAEKAHNKHSAKIIKEERPSGFTEEEIEIIANVARYHRGKKPKEKHESYSNLSAASQKITRQLSAFTRLADALDRSHSSVVNDLDCVFDSYTLTLFIVIKLNSPECSIEIDKAMVKKELFEEEFGVEIKFNIQ